MGLAHRFPFNFLEWRILDNPVVSWGIRKNHAKIKFHFGTKDTLECRETVSKVCYAIFAARG